MLPEQIEISDSDIEYAEKFLLPANCHFDDERKTFIKNLETCDLQAVPGSGKTTVLLAKLLILEKSLPFDDGSGILVLSHTNSAIDEIRNKIAKICPRLFAYPNFVGTIQSFVDNHMAIPFYTCKMKKKIYRIDNEVYEEKMSDFSSTFLPGFSRQEQNNAKSFLRSNDLFKKYRFTHTENRFELTDKYCGNTLNIHKPRGNTRPQNYRDWLDSEKLQVKEWLKKYKKQILGNGYLSYDDAYFLAFEYYKVYRRIKNILQNRFSFVFVDEMQDMDKHQHDLLEKLFFDNGNGGTVFQRIGDKNQAIFDGEVKLENIWINRAKKLELNGSNRLTSKNAEAVKYFGLNFLEIEGRNKNEDQSEIDIKPYIIVFNNATKLRVIEKFADLIKKFQDEKKIPLNPKYPFKAISWRKEVDGDNKIALSDYFDFRIEKHKPKIDYNCLADYLLNCNIKTKEYREIRKNIINVLLKILRLENIQTSDGRNYTELKLIAFIKEKDRHLILFESFNMKIFRWSTGIIRKKYQDVIGEMKNYIPEFLSLFASGMKVDKSTDFVIAEAVGMPQTSASSNNEYENVFIKGDIKIEVTTVHSAKGRTHTATLYLESFYHRGQGNYESQRLKDQFKGNVVSGTALDVVKQSARMIYVGFSRPTHLLCFAVHKDRFDANLNNIDRNKWEIIELQ